MRAWIRAGAIVSVAVAVLWPAVGDAGTPTPVSLEITKSVVGTVPAGTTFTVQVDCDVTEGGEGGPTTQTLEFDADGGTQTISVPQFQPTCTVQELDTEGFQVFYSGGADSDDTCTFADTDNGNSIEVSFPGAQLCQVMILNESDSTEPPPAPPVPPAPPAPASQVTPAFTG